MLLKLESFWDNGYRAGERRKRIDGDHRCYLANSLSSRHPSRIILWQVMTSELPHFDTLLPPSIYICFPPNPFRPNEPTNVLYSYLLGRLSLGAGLYSLHFCMLYRRRAQLSNSRIFKWRIEETTLFPSGVWAKFYGAEVIFPPPQ